MVFKRKPKPPLSEAAQLIRRAVLLIHAYWRDRSYHPSAADLALFRDLELMLFHSAGTVRRIAIRMERRHRGEPEIDESKWER